MRIVMIELTQGKFAKIDESDLWIVSQYQWHACERAQTFYAATSAVRRKGGSSIYMHRLIAGAAKGEHVDHINGDGLDCTSGNLRICSNAQNRKNTRKTRGSSRFKGVCRNRTNSTRIWEAYIWVDNRKIGLGSYETEEDAARAYNAAAIVHHGEFARLNIIEGLSHEESIVAPARNSKPGRPARARAIAN